VSFDLAFWRQESVPTLEEAAQVYDQLTDGLEGVVGEDPKVREFYQALTAVYPDLTDENMDTSPWTSPLYETRECVIAAISGSRSSEVAPILLGLSSRFGLTAYDPQNQIVLAVD
jgi:hypothetical protein